MAQSESMTENFPGAPGGGPADGPRDDQRAETPGHTGDPGSGAIPAPSPWSGHSDAVPPAPASPPGHGGPSAGQPGDQPVHEQSVHEQSVHEQPTVSTPQSGGAEPSPWSPAGYAYYGANQPTGPATPTGSPVPTGVGPQSGPNPQVAYQQPGYGGYQQAGQTGPIGPIGPSTGQTAAYPYGTTTAAPEQRKRRSGGLIAGVAVLALVIGGAAGALGGYLASGNGDSTVFSSLDEPSASQTANAPAGSVQSVAAKLLPVVVTIAAEFQTQGEVNGDTGSGVVISSDGDILTNNHVIADAVSGGKIQVIFANGRTVDATVVGRDPTTDIAVIKAQGVTGLPIAKLGSSNSLSVGQEVVAVGAPFQLSGTVTSGIISSLHRPTEAGDGGDASQTTVLDAIQTDAPINPGNSGGPLVDMQGQVIGINSAIYSPNSSSGSQGTSQGGNVGIGFAIPMDQAKRTADEIVKTGKATQTVLGVTVTDNTPTTGGEASILPNGALIKTVTPNGAAAKAGMKAGAVVVKADNRVVSSSDGLVAAVHAAAPGDKMTLTLADGSTVTVTLAGQPVSVN
jgi:putative serine protease PepD